MQKRMRKRAAKGRPPGANRAPSSSHTAAWWSGGRPVPRNSATRRPKRKRSAQPLRSALAEVFYRALPWPAPVRCSRDALPRNRRWRRRLDSRSKRFKIESIADLTPQRLDPLAAGPAPVTARPATTCFLEERGSKFSGQTRSANHSSAVAARPRPHRDPPPLDRSANSYGRVSTMSRARNDFRRAPLFW